MKARIPVGGLRECLVRSLLYVGMPRASVDERGFAAIRRLRGVRDDRPRPTLAEFKTLLREQYFMLLLDEEATLNAIPDLLPSDRDLRRKALAALRQVLSASREIAGETAERLQRIAQLFGVGPVCDENKRHVGQAFALYHQRVVTPRFETFFKIFKNRLAVVTNLSRFSMNQFGGSHNFTSKGLTDRLMSETNTEERNPSEGLVHRTQISRRSILSGWTLNALWSLCAILAVHACHADWSLRTSWTHRTSRSDCALRTCGEGSIPPGKT